MRYRTCDLTDAAAVQAVADEVRATSAQIDLVLHGAGLHDGGDISRLTLDGLRRIRDVKRGYHHLRAAFSDPEPVLFAAFGSVAGLVGLNGECDYAPGNDVLHGAATYGTAALGRRELTFAWPIWSDIGMGGSEPGAGQQRRERDHDLARPGRGVAHFVREPARRAAARTGGQYLHPREIGTFSQRFPGFVAPAEPGRRWLLGVPRQQSATTCTWTLDVSTQALPWLTHHRVAGRPTVPGAALAALAAEAAQRLLPEAAVVALHDLRLTAFVAPGRHPHTVHALLEEPVEGAAGGPRVRVRVSSDVVDPRGRLLRADRPLFECVVEARRVDTRRPGRRRAPGGRARRRPDAGRRQPGAAGRAVPRHPRDRRRPRRRDGGVGTATRRGGRRRAAARRAARRDDPHQAARAVRCGRRGRRARGDRAGRRARQRGRRDRGRPAPRAGGAAARPADRARRGRGRRRAPVAADARAAPARATAAASAASG
ncbi:hypothetical protein GCM10025868_21760 [Angustibacter aerolatus]|uniref:Polyketide/metazoan fatty acid synthase-like dehydratase domain-containing protein n=1 Tax=Angustibacter aerolatus TaxID=1162965 RepID=A0ABQ6JH96_9ACTN|nr:hypothetical protein GCM10025868_21760 [Angustibacter aerolatus]